MSKFIDGLVCERNGNSRHDTFGFVVSRLWERKNDDESCDHYELLDEYKCAVTVETIIALKRSEQEEGLGIVRNNLIRYVYSDFIDKIYLIEKAMFERDINLMKSAIHELKKEVGIGG